MKFCPAFLVVVVVVFVVSAAGGGGVMRDGGGLFTTKRAETCCGWAGPRSVLLRAVPVFISRPFGSLTVHYHDTVCVTKWQKAVKEVTRVPCFVCSGVSGGRGSDDGLLGLLLPHWSSLNQSEPVWTSLNQSAWSSWSGNHLQWWFLCFAFCTFERR